MAYPKRKNRGTLFRYLSERRNSPSLPYLKTAFDTANNMASSNTSFGSGEPPPNPHEPFSRSFTRESEAAPSNEDGLLLSRIQRGDEDAMALVFDRYSKVVYSVALRVLRDPSAAEDVLQDIFMGLWRKPESFLPNRGSLGGWLAVVARNRSIDALRRRKPTDEVEEMTLASPFNLEEDSVRTLMMERARSVIVALPVEQRKVVEMAFFDGLTHTEIAELTGDPLGTVKTRIRTALLVLRKAMQS